nr:MAG TPA: hypothetical protein [Ackermannviridae sp.]
MIIKSIFKKFKKPKKDVKLKEDTAKEMLDKLGVYELDDISNENLIKIAGIYKKTVGGKYDFDQPIDCVAWLQGLYDGAYTNTDDNKYDEFGERRLNLGMQNLTEDPDAKKLTDDRSDFLELSPGSKIDYIHSYIYGFQFAASNELKCNEKKTFKYKDGIEWNKKLK